MLIEGGGSPDRNRLLDVKEARPSSVLQFVNGAQPESFPTEAHRIVEAARRLLSQPPLGLAPVEFGGRPYRVREMVPDENRSSLDRLQKKPRRLRLAMEVIGQVTAWSQLRGTDTAGRQALAGWVQGPGLSAVLAAAVRFADQTVSDYAAYHETFSA